MSRILGKTRSAGKYRLPTMNTRPGSVRILFLMCKVLFCVTSTQVPRYLEMYLTCTFIFILLFFSRCTCKCRSKSPINPS